MDDLPCSAVSQPLATLQTALKDLYFNYYEKIPHLIRKCTCQIKSWVQKRIASPLLLGKDYSTLRA